MVDKFGLSVGLTRGADRQGEIEEDLNMNFNRIVNLKHPTQSMDAATKRFVKQSQKKLEAADDKLEAKIVNLQEEMRQMKTAERDDLMALRKMLDSKVDISDCSSTNGGRMDVDLDMRKNRILNLPLPRTDNEPITKAVYGQLVKELYDLRVLVQKHTMGRSRRDLPHDILEEESEIDRIKNALLNRG